MGFLEERITDLEMGCWGDVLEFVNILDWKIPDLGFLSSTHLLCILNEIRCNVMHATLFISKNCVSSPDPIYLVTWLGMPNWQVFPPVLCIYHVPATEKALQT